MGKNLIKKIEKWIDSIYEDDEIWDITNEELGIP